MNLSDQVKVDQDKFVKGQAERVRQAGEYLRDRLKEAMAPLSKSGTLRESIKVRVEGKGVVVVYSDCEYAKHVKKFQEMWTRTIAESGPALRQIIFGGK